MRIPKIALMRRARVDLGLVERVGDFVGEDAGGEAGDDLFGFDLVGGVQNVVVDEDVVAEEGELGLG